MLQRLIGVLALVSACGDSAAPAQPASPPPPPGLDTEGEPLFELDTTTPEIVTILVNAPEGTSLIGRLASPAGKRALVLRTGKRETLLAEADWNILATGAFEGDGEALICWNVLTGPESDTRGMPHPSTGLEVRCRTWTDAAGPVTSVTDAAEHEWLIEVTSPSPGSLVVTTYRDAAGWMFVASPGDGYVRRSYAAGALGPPTPPSPRR